MEILSDTWERELARTSYVLMFGGLALLAWQCPCDRIFECHQGMFQTVLVTAAALFFVTNADRLRVPFTDGWWHY